MNKNLIVIFTFALLFFAVKPLDAADKLLPIDQASINPSFMKFRQSLLKAVRKKDKSFLLRVVTENVVNTPGVGNGKENFIGYWEIDNPKSRIWNELETILNLGAISYKDNIFWAPYLIKYNKVLSFEDLVVISKNVKLFSARDKSSKVLRVLSYDVVESQCNEEGACSWTWMKIKTKSGEVGFVSSNLVRSPFQHRVKFANKKGKWLIVAFDADY